MTKKVLVGVCLLALIRGLGAEEPATPPAQPAPLPASMAFYNFSDLINKADRIILGEIAEKKEGAFTIKALETLKAPNVDPKKVAPDAYKRAEELLKSGKSDLPPQLKKKTDIENINVAVIPINEKVLPPPGTQAVFFLWDVEPRQDGGMPLYKINHPQCVYDTKVLPQVRAGLVAPRSISDGRFLRDWDKRAADRVHQRKEDEDLKKAPGGETVQGMKLEIVRPHVMIRGDNSFQIATHIINTFSKETMVYDGPAASYGVIICAKNAPPETALVFRLNTFDDVDPVSLNITNLTDFGGVPGNSLLTREHIVDAKKFPALKTLTGECTVKMFYSSTKNGLKDGLNSPAWVGTMISKELTLEFKKVDSKAP